MQRKLLAFVVPLLFAGLCLLTNLLWLELGMAPFWCLIGLVLAARLSTIKGVIGWFVVYLILVIFSFYRLAALHSYDYQLIAFCSRIVGFIIVGALIINEKRRMEIMKRQLESVKAVVMSIPSPVILADDSGMITLVNKEVTDLMGMTEDKLLGQSFFQYFINPQKQGEAIARYINVVDAPNFVSVETELLIRNLNRVVKARQLRVLVGERHFLLNILL